MISSRGTHPIQNWISAGRAPTASRTLAVRTTAARIGSYVYAIEVAPSRAIGAGAKLQARAERYAAALATLSQSRPSREWRSISLEVGSDVVLRAGRTSPME